ncbi:MAG: efflux RND transporter periplasmic adaptor subunit [Curvibacter sp.]|nr:MAG: efflux RND transporter periplasmic adaptor subunit [Curvibacter sp.]
MLRLRLATPFLICALPLALVACGEKAVSDPRAGLTRVRVAVVQPATPSSRAFTGTVAARVQSDLGFRVPGKVLERLVDAGQTVKRGQVLMRIDSVDLGLAAQAQAEAVLAARARAHQTADDEARYRDLRGTGAISASAYDQIKAAADTARAQLSAAEAQARVALNASRYAELVADGDGVVVETLAEPGQVVAAGQVVVRLAHAGQREALIQLPETLRPAIGSVAQASLFGKEGVEVVARLRQLSSAADRLTRTFEARYVLDGDLAQAPLGSTVVIRVHDRGTPSAGSFNVPLASLYDPGQGPGVWVIRGEPARVSWQRVAVERLDDASAQVTGKLKQGDRIVALGAHLLREDQEVQGLDGVATAAAQGARP